MFQPLGKRVLIEEIIQEKKEKILILKDDNAKKFKVIEIGDEVKKVAVGDVIIVGNYATTEVKCNDRVYTFLQEENIIAKVAS